MALGPFSSHPSPSSSPQSIRPRSNGSGSEFKGLFPTKPYRRKFGLIKVLMVAFISLMAGAKVAEKGASFLEESEIFVHSDDEDE
uniref:Essential MCU regulator, mitochondrial n=1 Tax=Globodera rostochiensis TaxID=31243 RepID=A0A914HAY7_GLORO